MSNSLSFSEVQALVDNEMSTHGCESHLDLVDVPMGLAFLSKVIEDLIGFISDEDYEQIENDLEWDPRLEQQLRMLPSSDTCQPPYHFEEGYQEVPEWYWKLQ